MPTGGATRVPTGTKRQGGIATGPTGMPTGGATFVGVTCGAFLIGTFSFTGTPEELIIVSFAFNIL
jgi:hypothetical protein